MYIFLYLLLLLLSFFYKKNNNFNILIILFISIIVFMHPYCPDYANYENVYNTISFGYKYLDTGIGWYYICLIFSKIGISFRVFKTIICFISLLLINHTVKDILDNKHQKYFWGFYLIFPILIQCIQFRFLLATAIVIFSLKCLSKRNIKSVIYSITSLLLASSIHSSYYFILIVYLILLIKPCWKHVKVSATIIFLVLLVLIINQKFLIEFISNFINIVRIERYFTVNNEKGSLFTIILNIMALYINYKPLDSLIKNKEIKNIDNFSKNILLFTNKLSILSILIIPFLFFDNNFIRILEIFIMITNISLLVYKQNGIQYLTIFKTKIKIFDFLLFTSMFYFIIFIPKYAVFWTMLK